MIMPLDLRLSSPPRFLVGEGVVLSISHRVQRALEMETVELNRNRTRVVLSWQEPDGPRQQVLTGLEHASWHRLSQLTEIGRRFSAVSGDVWTSELELLNYRGALAAGRYQLGLEYRYGDAPDDVVHSNTVEFEVVPRELRAVRFRWFGESNPRGELAAVRVMVEGEASSWFFQTASPEQPEILRTSANLCASDWPMIEAPRLCHLNDIHGFHFERQALWLDPDGVSAVAVHVGGRQAEPRRFSHGLLLDPPPLLVDPPLQLRAERVAAVLMGADANGAPVAALLRESHDGTQSVSLAALPPNVARHAGAVWSATEDPAEASLFFAASVPGGMMFYRLALPSGVLHEVLPLAGVLQGLVVEQWLGNGAVFALCADRERGRRTLYRCELGESTGVAELDWGPLGGELTDEAPLQLVAFADRSDVAALFLHPDEWVVATSAGIWRTPRLRGGGPPSLVATPKGELFVLEWERAFGFKTQRVALGPRTSP
jgi:hypothetical protein